MANSYSGGFALSSRRGSRSASPNLKLLGLLGLAGVAAAMLIARKPGDVVMGQSGNAYRHVLVSNAGGVKTFDLYSAGSGLLLLRYSQTGSDMNSRRLVAVGQGVDQATVRVAASDFGVPLPS